MKNLLLTISILASQLVLSQKSLEYKFIEYDNQKESIHKLYELTDSRSITFFEDKVIIEDSEHGEDVVYSASKKNNEEWGYWYYLNKGDKEYVLEVSYDEYQIVLYSDIKNQTLFYTK